MSHRITLKNFQSFDEVGAGVCDVGRINILVGPNNAGKSKVLRAIDRTVNSYKDSLIASAGSSYTVEIERSLTEEEVRRIFPERHMHNTFGDLWRSLGMHVGLPVVTFTLHANASAAAKEVRVEYSQELQRWNRDLVKDTVSSLISQGILHDTLDKFPLPVYYISAERNVVQEREDQSDAIAHDGVGVTNLFRKILTTAGVSKEPIEKWLLADLNRVLAPDHQFSRIQVLQHADKTWEIFLEEFGKGLVPLSQCGSGLKTVIHLLAYTNLVAKRSGGKITTGTFLCEELENCLHPHVQRNLFSYLDDIIELPARAFLTTHSSVCLDFFQGQDDAMLTHVYQDKGKTRSRPIEAYNDQCGVLDGIGAKASDALQSNAVVWVEGPSDRIYLKKWLALCGSDLREGRDFSIMFYGGALLTHLSLNPIEKADEFVRLLRINRNSAIIMDSDKQRANDPLKSATQRIKDEVESEAGRFIWITKGKEIENYISAEFLGANFRNAPPVAQYDPPWKVLNGIYPVDSNAGLHTKVDFAEFVTSKATEDDFTLDWRERTEKLIAFLRRANFRG